MIKRTFDILLSALGLIILLPVAVPIALIIYIDDRGPVFFRQKRVGLNLQPFTLYKFRSMTINKNSSEGSFDAGNQSRVTGIGKLIRKTKLDELPQLINVLKGDMSLVGPRPEVKKWVDVYPQQWAFVLTVKPGITDNAAILFRNEEEILSRVTNPENHYKEIILPQKLNIYSKYINNHSFTGDLEIIIKTIYSILKRQ
ncbi:MAG: sugar transferase [Bacteroidia bacterium]|nr:sugar transferase [Bacteroidia bacterium]